MIKIRPAHYLQLLTPSFSTKRTREILSVNPTIIPERKEAAEICICVYDYNEQYFDEHSLNKISESFSFYKNERKTWLNIDGIRKKDIEELAKNFEIHPLIVDDILSIAQRPKMDEIEGKLFCVLNMLYFNDEESSVEQEQVSIILGNDFLITIQEDATRDVLDPIRDKLRLPNSRLRQSGVDYLCYLMLDVIVDNYYLVLEKLGDKIETLEEEIIRKSDNNTLAKINNLRKELIVLKRNVIPVRDLINGFIRTDSKVMEDKTRKYFRDIYNHTMQASDLVENYRDMMMSLQDLYMSKVNLRLNEIMKVMAVVTCLLAPATVISGIFGMNFDIIPAAHQKWGFYFAVILMLAIPVWMLTMFKRRGWF
ncbi:MAG: corA [Chitinophagaceae bacterium]|nr:corA [Chitinophagaceae bacterium]